MALDITNTISEFGTKWGPLTGKVVTVAQISLHAIMIVEKFRKHATIKSQNINMTEFGHETGQRFDQYN